MTLQIELPARGKSKQAKPNDSGSHAGVSGNIRRPEPVPGLNAQEAAHWRLIVARMPADWFTAETWPILANLCRHIVNSERIIEALRRMGADLLALDLVKYDRLSNMLQRESRAISELSSKLRITPQARYEITRATAEIKNNGGHHSPWNKQ